MPATTWKGTYKNHEIEVVNTWFNGERLFVDGKLQDERINFSSANLTGHLISEQNEKLAIKVNIGGIFTISCRVFVDDEKVEMRKI